MQVRCKCHGMSGSCELKTCWKVAPDFRIVGKALKDRFRSAVLVTQSNLGSVTPSSRIRGFRRRGARRLDRQKQKKNRIPGRRKKPRDLAKQLFYYQKSPNFCERDPVIDIAGTTGRRCNKTSTGGDGCGSLCCGRGYNVVRQRRLEHCRCKFHWCCFVQCQNCTVEEWITVCKWNRKRRRKGEWRRTERRKFKTDWEVPMRTLLSFHSRSNSSLKGSMAWKRGSDDKRRD